MNNTDIPTPSPTIRVTLAPHNDDAIKKHNTDMFIITCFFIVFGLFLYFSLLFWKYRASKSELRKRAMTSDSVSTI